MWESIEAGHHNGAGDLLRRDETIENEARFMEKFRCKEGWESLRSLDSNADDGRAPKWDDELLVKSDDVKKSGEEPKTLEHYYFTAKLIQKFEHIMFEVDERSSMTMVHKVMDWGKREQAIKTEGENLLPTTALSEPLRADIDEIVADKSLLWVSVARTIGTVLHTSIAFLGFVVIMFGFYFKSKQGISASSGTALMLVGVFVVVACVASVYCVRKGLAGPLSATFMVCRWVLTLLGLLCFIFAMSASFTVGMLAAIDKFIDDNWDSFRDA